MQTCRPCGTVEEMKPQFSGKHHLYGSETEVSVLTIGLAINHTRFHTGATAHVAFFRANTSFHTAFLQKCDNAEDWKDTREDTEPFPHSWAVHMDKGYT